MGIKPDYSRRNASNYVPDLNNVYEMQARFCDEYLIDLNPRQAAIRAGYAVDKATYAAAQVMKHPPCADLIAKKMAMRSRRVGITAERVLDRLGAIAFGDTRKLFNEFGGLRPPGELSADDALLIQGVKTRKIVALNEDGKMQPEEITEVKTVDNLAAITLVMKHLGMLNDKLDINVTHTLADRLAAAHKRVADRRPGASGPVIDGEFVEDVATSLRDLEEHSRTLQNQITHEAAPALTWDDVL